MGNSSTKESRPSGARSRSGDPRSPNLPSFPGGASGLAQISSNASSLVYPIRTRNSVPEPFVIGSAPLDAAVEPRKETKQEREARKAEKERVVRAKERERSLREEGVDGGYMVTLGTYTGPEDFSKTIVRQLMIERRLAPFWRGLNDHSDSWTEHQLVAAARELPIPAPDEIPLEEAAESSTTPTQPIAVRNAMSRDQPTDTLSPFHGVFSTSATSPSSAPTGSSPLFRGRSKTLASLTSKNGSQQDLVTQEIRLPYDPYVNGQRLEAYLYKDASECPICFLYYPPYLNRTRCCDQPICSECFVQIKRPDPHAPEHADPSQPTPPEGQPQPEEGLLVSEPAQCPFCVQPEFGVSYEPPPFRRGLAYPAQAGGGSAPFVKEGSPMSLSPFPSSATAASPPQTRRRATSLSATASQVITTDRVRPDWAKKLSDARAHAARKSAAATALHNAAYLMGSLDSAGSRFGLGRRRRNQSDGGIGFFPTPEGMPIPDIEMLLSVLEGQRLASATGSSGGAGRSRGPVPGSQYDLEEVMLMEAIRQSLASEEDRRKKEEKEQAKQSKKDEKAKAKEQKQIDKAAKKGGSQSTGNDGSSSFYSAANGRLPGSGMASPDGKGKAKAGAPPTLPSDFAVGSFASAEGSSMPWDADYGSSVQDPQRHLELSRANLDSGLTAPLLQQTLIPGSGSHLRQVSDASSTASSLNESRPGSVRNDVVGSDSSFNPSPNRSGQYLPFGSQPPHSQHLEGVTNVAIPKRSEEAGGASTSPSTDQSLNFRSLAAMMVKEQVAEGAGHGVAHIEQIQRSPQIGPAAASMSGTGAAEASISATHVPIWRQGQWDGVTHESVGDIGRDQRRDRDRKEYGNVNVVGPGFGEHMATQ